MASPQRNLQPQQQQQHSAASLHSRGDSADFNGNSMAPANGHLEMLSSTLPFPNSNASTASPVPSPLRVSAMGMNVRDEDNSEEEDYEEGDFIEVLEDGA